jgi:hypothetical protein
LNSSPALGVGADFRLDLHGPYGGACAAHSSFSGQGRIARQRAADILRGMGLDGVEGGSGVLVRYDLVRQVQRRGDKMKRHNLRICRSTSGKGSRASLRNADFCITSGTGAINCFCHRCDMLFHARPARRANDDNRNSTLLKVLLMSKVLVCCYEDFETGRFGLLKQLAVGQRALLKLKRRAHFVR